MGQVLAYERWYARIQDIITPWTEHEIIYFRKAIGLAGIKDERLRNTLYNRFNSIGAEYKITKEQSDKGQNYLLTKSYKKNGQLRKNCILGTRELAILRSLDTHYFVGLYGTSNEGYYLPIYKAVSHTGDSFEYTGTTYEQIVVISNAYSNRLKLVQ